MNYIKIENINHDRFVGISDNGTAVAFDPANVRGYRPPKTEKELKACYEEAERYYNNCIPGVRYGDFKVSETPVESIIELSDYNMDDDELAEYYGIKY